jgi:hypothetical protein
MRNVKMFLTLSRIARPVGFRPDAVKPGFHRARTQWIRGFMAFHWVRGRVVTSRRVTSTGFRPDAVKPGFHRARTQWIRGFMAFKLPRRTRTVILMVLA